jgi:hypothetical protein
MPDETSREPGAAEEARELREQEREVAERDPDERDTEDARSEGDVPSDAGGVTPVPPANVQHGSVSQ